VLVAVIASYRKVETVNGITQIGHEGQTICCLIASLFVVQINFHKSVYVSSTAALLHYPVSKAAFILPLLLEGASGNNDEIVKFYTNKTIW